MQSSHGIRSCDVLWLSIKMTRGLCSFGYRPMGLKFDSCQHGLEVKIVIRKLYSSYVHMHRPPNQIFCGFILDSENIYSLSVPYIKNVLIAFKFYPIESITIVFPQRKKVSL
jgi:hypothetical protein